MRRGVALHAELLTQGCWGLGGMARGRRASRMTAVGHAQAGVRPGGTGEGEGPRPGSLVRLKDSAGVRQGHRREAERQGALLGCGEEGGQWRGGPRRPGHW